MVNKFFLLQNGMNFSQFSLPLLRDASFYNILQEVRLGNLSPQTKQLISEKVASHQNNAASIDTTYICGFHHEADTINK